MQSRGNKKLIQKTVFPAKSFSEGHFFCAKTPLPLPNIFGKEEWLKVTSPPPAASSGDGSGPRSQLRSG